MKKILLTSLLLLCATSVFATTLIKTVAVVNNDVVTSYQLEKKLALVMATSEGKRQFSQKEHAALRLSVLNDMIDDLLVEQRIHELGLTVTDQELNSAIEDVQRQNKLTSEQLKDALQAQGMSFEGYRQQLQKEILRYKLIAKEVHSKVEVTNAEIRAYFDAHKDEYMTVPTLHLLRISYPLPKDATAEQITQIKQKAQIARQLLLEGKPFAEVLAGVGTDANGGDMGTMIEKEMHPELHKMVATLKVGQINEPTEALGSIHIFQVLERTPAKAELTDEVSAAIEKILATQNSEKRFAEWKKELRQDAVVDIRI
ncbi:SurA N-terminal domain-containing protein [Geopsychrobacter electrodiphilus]|uniref:SurA N-terminal domain-containing protein n=1 Tax=Geopsychrobacter electrodiphilus TaxID=225196 RepID=UPI000378D725|nr:SurA N-terminal domain-containing protein [Geopsychrobacter electrodiphilus]